MGVREEGARIERAISRAERHEEEAAIEDDQRWRTRTGHGVGGGSTATSLSSPPAKQTMPGGAQTGQTLRWHAVNAFEAFGPSKHIGSKLTSRTSVCGSVKICMAVLCTAAWTSSC